MASNPTSFLSIMTLPVNISTSFRFGWIAKAEKSMDRYEGRRSKKTTDALEKKYNLIPSSKVSERTTTETPKFNVVQGNIKEQVANTVRSAMKHYTFCSLGELNAILSKYNLAVEEVKTGVSGERNMTDWSMFRLTTRATK